MSPELHEQEVAPPALSETRPWYWSVRRELWENRSIYIAPLTVASIFLFGFFFSAFRLPGKVRALAAMTPAAEGHAVSRPFGMAAAMILMTGFIVAMFYCLDALNGERRDRSILFWKSLPVSDRTTVLSKAAIPLLVLPAVTYAIALATQLVMFLWSTIVLLGAGVNPAPLWTRVPLFQMALIMAYGLSAHVLWFAPIYGWLLLVSAWARRVVVLWALLPFVVILVLDHLAGLHLFASFLKYRLGGAMIEAFSVNAAKVPITRFSQLTPGNFLLTAGLWLGLAFAAACLAAAIRLRRNREPM